MQNDNFENELNTLRKPSPDPANALVQARAPWLTARRSAGWGVLLLILPVFFFTCVAVKYYMGVSWGLADVFSNWIAEMDKQSNTSWLSPLLFVILPAAVLLANLAAIMGFAYDRLRKELIATIRLRWINLILAITSLIIMAMVLIYGIMENAHHRALEQYGL